MSRSFRLLLSASSGIFLSLAWLGLPGWTLFFALVPLLILDQFFVQHKTAYRGVSFWGHTFLAFLIWNSLTTWWIAYATFAGALMAIVVNAFLMSLVWWLAHSARRRFKSNLGYIALVAFWISFEFFHFHWDIEWPWLTLGNGFANNVRMIQWFEFTGTLGGSLWVLVLNIQLFQIIKIFREKALSGRYLVTVPLFLLVLLVPWVYSIIVYHSYSEKEDPLEIVLVQPNIDPYSERYDPQAENEKLEIVLRLAEERTDDKTELVVGPETLFERYPDWKEGRFSYNYQYRQLVDWLRNYPNAEMIFGASTSKIYAGPEEASPTAREREGVHYDVFNSAIMVNPQGNEQVYHKSILVAGVEKMPFMNYLGFLNDLVFDLGGTTGSLGRQDEPSNFELKNGLKVAPVICYESVFGEYLTKYVRKGAGLIVVITNDGWWRNTPGYKQHLSFARIRAIETRRSVARSANTGISGFINQKGDLLESTGWWTEAVLKETLNMNDKITFYVRHGDYIARIALFASALLALFMVMKRFMGQ